MRSTIGIFDSGIGGLTVVSEIMKKFPNEEIIYLGDTARVPYGTRGRDVISQYAKQLTGFLLKKNVKLLIVACNTMSAVSLQAIKKLAKTIPVIDVITPTVKVALTVSKTKRIGVIGTNATIQTKAYENQIKKFDKNAKVFQKACPLFVPLVEEGFRHHTSTELIAKTYLEPMIKNHIDTLILGCTHYPFLKPTITRIMGEKVMLVDSAVTTAEVLENMLKTKFKKSEQKPVEIYLTDLKSRSQIEEFLGSSNIIIKKASL